MIFSACLLGTKPPFISVYDNDNSVQRWHRFLNDYFDEDTTGAGGRGGKLKDDDCDNVVARTEDDAGFQERSMSLCKENVAMGLVEEMDEFRDFLLVH